MIEHNIVDCLYAFLTNAQLPPLKVMTLWFDKLVILDPLKASWNTIGADQIARGAGKQLQARASPRRRSGRWSWQKMFRRTKNWKNCVRVLRFSN
jgi:hypothetical protein